MANYTVYDEKYSFDCDLYDLKEYLQTRYLLDEAYMTTLSNISNILESVVAFAGGLDVVHSQYLVFMRFPSIENDRLKILAAL